MSPRVKPDGKVVLINKGTAQAPNVQLVPTVDDINNGTDITQYLQLAMDRYRYRAYSPQRELLWRLNEGLQGRHPGEPVNWRGERGLVLS